MKTKSKQWKDKSLLIFISPKPISKALVLKVTSYEKTHTRAPDEIQ